MNAADVIGYAFDGAVYCLDCVPQAADTGCTCGNVDEYGACEDNCHGYGPNVIFAGDEGPHGGCDECGELLDESEDEVMDEENEDMDEVLESAQDQQTHNVSMQFARNATDCVLRFLHDHKEEAITFLFETQDQAYLDEWRAREGFEFWVKLDLENQRRLVEEAIAFYTV